MNLRAQQFQSLADDIEKDYEELPQFTSQYRSNGTPFTLEPILLAQYSNFGAQEDVVTGQRLYGEAGLELSDVMALRVPQAHPEIPAGRLRVERRQRAQRYSADDSPAAGAPLVNVDGSLIFERETSFAGKGSATRHWNRACTTCTANAKTRTTNRCLTAPN